MPHTAPTCDNSLRPDLNRQPQDHRSPSFRSTNDSTAVALLLQQTSPVLALRRLPPGSCLFGRCGEDIEHDRSNGPDLTGRCMDCLPHERQKLRDVRLVEGLDVVAF